jgi:transposase-like protein
MLCPYSNYSRERKRVILRKKLTMPSQAISSEMRSRLVTVRGFVWRKTLFRQRGQTNPKVAPENRSTARVESGGAPLSEVCDRHGLSPSVFYRWQKHLFECGAAAFERRWEKKSRREEERIARLEAKLRKKDEVLGELMEERIALGKELGEL